MSLEPDLESSDLKKRDTVVILNQRVKFRQQSSKHAKAEKRKERRRMTVTVMCKSLSPRKQSTDRSNVLDTNRLSRKAPKKYYDKKRLLETLSRAEVRDYASFG